MTSPSPPSPQEEEEEVQLSYKIILLGDGSTGKTSVARRQSEGAFSQSYLQTLGVDWMMNTVKLPQNHKVTLQIWDIGGQQLNSKLLPKYIYGSHAVIFTYDITAYRSYKNLLEWHSLVQKALKEKKPLMALVGNKTDLQHLRSVRSDIAEKWANDNSFLNFEVSAKSGEGIHSMFFRIASELAGIHVPNSEVESKVITAQIINHPLESDSEEPKSNDSKKKSKKKTTCSVM